MTVASQTTRRPGLKHIPMATVGPTEIQVDLYDGSGGPEKPVGPQHAIDADLRGFLQNLRRILSTKNKDASYPPANLGLGSEHQE